MSVLLERFQVRQFWRFDGLGPKQIGHYFRLDSEAAGEPAVLANANEFIKIFEIVRAGVKNRQLQIQRVKCKLPLLPLAVDTQAHFQITGFSPSDGQIEMYEEGLKRCIDSDGRLKQRIPNSHHNIISVALLIEFGKTRVILGGDVEGPGWDDVLKDFPKGRFPAAAVKVSHHGSTNGYVDGLWEQFADGAKPIAVVAPFRRFGLPSQTAIDHIRGLTESILATCPPAGDTQRIPLSPTAPVRSREAMRRELKVRPRKDLPCAGRCTLVFDDAGKCVKRELVPPARII